MSWPAASSTASAPVKASPAAVGSTAATFTAGKCFDFFAVTSMEPSLPSFKTTVFTPNASSFSAASRAETRPRTSSPVSRASSVSFGETMSARARISSGQYCGGPASSTVSLPALRARRRAAATASRGISRTAVTASACSITSLARSMSAGFRLKLAAGSTAMQLFPLGKTIMKALPLARSGSRRMWVVSIFSFTNP